jgi:hypothetical protein
MTSGRETQPHLAERQHLAVAERLQRATGLGSITVPHDRDRLWGRENSGIARPRVIAVAVRDDGARDRHNRVDIKPTRFAIEPRPGRAQPGLRARRGDMHGRHMGIRTSLRPPEGKVGIVNLSSLG